MVSTNTDEIFINEHDLPSQLPKEEVYELLDKIKQGDNLAKAKLAEHNIRLVLRIVTNRFSRVDYDKKDLVSIGNIGLMKAISTFDTSKDFEFATYATRCIDNEILHFLRKIKKDKSIVSLEATAKQNKDGNELKFEEILSDGTDFVEEYTDNITFCAIRKIIKDLPTRDREIIMLYFGFNNYKTYTQAEISKMLSISQPHIGRLIQRILKKIGGQLEEKGLIEFRENHISTDKSNPKSEEEKPKTIYEYFKKYTKEQVDAVLEKLSEEERKLISLRYDGDVNNPVTSKLNKVASKKFYDLLLPKMKTLLENPENEIRCIKKGAISTEYDKNCIIEKTQNIPLIETSETKIIDKQPASKNVTTILKNEIAAEGEKSNDNLITKEEYIKILELLKTPSFTKIISEYPAKEAIIIFLKLGYIDEKCFSNLAISKFLGIEQQEVIDITRKILLKYKESITQNIDQVIKSISDESDITAPSQVKNKHYT